MKQHVYTVGIVDDRPEELDMIRLYIRRLEYLQVVFDESDPMAALRTMEQDCPDILLLDIKMPGLNGIRLYQSLPCKPVLIICSGYPKYGYEVSSLDAVAYLPKWMAFEDFEKAMQKAVQRCDQENQVAGMMEDSILVPGIRFSGAKINIPITRIIHVEIMDKIATFHCMDFERQARVSLDRLESLLPSDHFIRIHKSHIVRLDKVAEHSHSKLFVHGHSVPIPIGKSYALKVWERLNQKDQL
jgi:DNA-binding LytR/AlgR family response regulator